MAKRKSGSQTNAVQQVFIPKSSNPSEKRAIYLLTDADKKRCQYECWLIQPTLTASLDPALFAVHGRSYQDVLKQQQLWVQSGFKYVFSTDIKKGFDNTPLTLVYHLLLPIVGLDWANALCRWHRLPYYRPPSYEFEPAPGGLYQGIPNAPLLFNVAMSWVAKRLRGLGLNYFTIYADNIDLFFETEEDALVWQKNDGLFYWEFSPLI